MRPKELLHKYWHWLGLTLFAMLIALAALIAPNRISLLELEREAFAAENQILRKASRRPATRDPCSDGSRRRDTTHGTVQRCRLLDNGFCATNCTILKGDLVFTRGLANLRLNRPAIAASINSPTGTARRSDSYAGDGTNGPSHFARLHIPINLGSDVHGSLEIYLDQEQAGRRSDQLFRSIALVILALVGAGITIPLALAWTRGRAQRRAREEVLYLQSHDSLTGLANRAKFTERVGQALEHIQDDAMHMAVITVNIDRFGAQRNTRAPRRRPRAPRHRNAHPARRARPRHRSPAWRRRVRHRFDRRSRSEHAVMAFVHRLRIGADPAFPRQQSRSRLDHQLGHCPGPGRWRYGRRARAALGDRLSRAKLDGGQRMCFYEESMDKAVQQRHRDRTDLRQRYGAVSSMWSTSRNTTSRPRRLAGRKR